MSRFEFLEALKNSLSGLPQEDIKASIQYYNEMIDDRMEDGLSEEQAVAEIGEPKKVAEDILSEIPLSRLVKTKLKPKRSLNALEIVLLVLGSPVWISVLIAIFSVIIAVYVSLWSVVISVFAAFISVGVSGIATLIGSVIIAVFHTMAAAGVCLGASLILIGLSIPLYFVSALSFKGILLLTKKTFLLIKSCFIKKEAA